MGLALGVILLVVLPGEALMKLIEAGTPKETLLYGMTIILYLAVRKRLDCREGAFDSDALRCRSRSALWCGRHS
jgi:hypothetical protein